MYQFFSIYCPFPPIILTVCLSNNYNPLAFSWILITKHAIIKSGDWDKDVYWKASYNFYGKMHAI